MQDPSWEKNNLKFAALLQNEAIKEIYKHPHLIQSAFEEQKEYELIDFLAQKVVDI